MSADQTPRLGPEEVPEDPVGPAGLEANLAWAGIALGALALLVLAFEPTLPTTAVSLAGPWELVSGPGQRSVVALPGPVVAAGQAGVVTVERTIDVAVGSEPLALFAERVRYLAEVRVDGVVYDEESQAGDDGSPTRLFVPLPPLPPGPHQISATLLDPIGDGGVYGNVAIGPAEDLLLYLVRLDVPYAGLALGCSLLALVNLVAGARLPSRRDIVYAGWFFTGYALTQWLELPDLQAAGWPVAVGRLAICTHLLTLAAGIAMLAAQINGDRGRLEGGMGLLAAAIASVALIASAPWLPLIRSLSQVFALVSVGIVMFRVIHAPRSWGARSWLPIAFGAVMVGGLTVVQTGLTTASGALTDQSAMVASIAAAALAGSMISVSHAIEAVQHRRFVAGNPEPVLRVSREGVIEDRNAAARRVGLDAANLTAQVVGADLLRVRSHIARSVDSPDICDFVLNTGRRRLVVESRGTPDGTGYALLTLWNVTEQRRLEEGARKAARYETATTILSGIAHDFNNLLGTILAHVGAIRMVSPQGPQDGRLGQMETLVERASLLNRRLLAFSRTGDVDQTVSDVAAVVRNAVALVQPNLRDPVAMVTEIPDSLPLGLCGPDDLEQVLVGLLVVSADDLAGAGKMSVVVKRFGGPTRPRGIVIAIVIEQDPSGAPGSAEPTETIGYVAASRRIARNLGRLWTERPDAFTRIHLIALRDADVLEESEAPLPRGRRVLLVEPDQELREEHSQSLWAVGYAVTAVRDAEAARGLGDLDPDILVLEQDLPDALGSDLAAELTRDHPRRPVILMTNGSLPIPRKRHLLLGKPFRTRQLAALVGRAGRRAEREARGADDITELGYDFPPLDELSAAGLGIGPSRGRVGPEGGVSTGQ